MKRLLLTIALSLLAFTATAKEAVPLAEDPVVEQRLIAISEEMRCLVCQNESLAGSRADLAQDLRRESDEEIKTFMVSRYGDFVLYRPPVKPTTWLLWVGPFVLMLGAIAGFVIYVRKRSAEGDDEAQEEFA
jgi:cytochrome c-type biogenesis protein CcmH